MTPPTWSGGPGARAGHRVFLDHRAVTNRHPAPPREDTDVHRIAYGFHDHGPGPGPGPGHGPGPGPGHDHDHDVVVIGAGRAGPVAAVQLARHGLDVLVVERAVDDVLGQPIATVAGAA